MEESSWCIFESFVKLCWPDIYNDIDWKKGYKSLDKELSKISRNAPSGNRIVDKLIEVYLTDKKLAWVLVHLEVQGDYTADFEERMFICRYRLHDLYRIPAASLAILIDNDIHWRPSLYKKELWGSRLDKR